MGVKKNHGGKRSGAGRKSTPFNVILEVGQACEKMLQQKYVALNAEKKRELLEERSNIAAFHEYIQGILDLSRFRAAPSARLSHLPFESDRAFPAQC